MVSAVKNKALNRARIDKELKNLFDYPLTIVSAAMGYGKTTSVRSFLDRQTVKYAWVSCLECCGLEYLFWDQVVNSLKKMNPNISEKLKQIGFPSTPQQIADSNNAFRKAQNMEPIIIIFDDYHLMESSCALNTYIEMTARQAISNLHIVLLSRTRPQLNYTNLKSKDLCFYIDNDTMAFTPEEIRAYFNSMGLKVTEQDIQTVHAYTKGWISAIYLLISGWKQGGSVTATFDINQLVDENFYSCFDLETQQVLIQLSILESFTLEQAVEILHNTDIPQIMKNLIDQNAFISYDKYTGVYSIHNVLLNLLREKARIGNADMRPLYYSAGKWYLKKKEMYFAFEYYHKAGKTEELLGYINDIQNMDIPLLTDSLLQNILAEIGRNAYTRYPFSILQIAFDFILTRKPEQIVRAKEIIDILSMYASENHDLEISNKILGEIEILQIFLVFNDAERMIEHSLKADSLLNGDVSCIVYQHDAFTFGVPHFLYAYYREPGSLADTVSHILKGFPPSVFNGCGAGCEFLAVGEAALEQGDVQKAELYIKKAICKAETKNQISILFCAWFASIRLSLLTGDLKEVTKQLYSMKGPYTEPCTEMDLQHTRIYHTTSALCEAYIYGCLNKYDSIPDWIKTGDWSQGRFSMNGLAFQYIVYEKALVLSGNWAKLDALSDDFLDQYNVFHNQLGFLHHAVYLAAAKMNLYGLAEGSKVLLQALIEAKKDNIMLPFAENAKYILPMLYDLKESDQIDTSFLTELISLSERYKANIERYNKNNVQLTAREKDVLRLLSQGLTKKEIAEQSFLSVSSIKRCIESIYIKLEVNNKQRAIMKASELTWDCPCQSSLFDCKGNIFNNSAAHDIDNE